MSLAPPPFAQTSNGFARSTNARLGQSQAVPKSVPSLDLPALQSASRVLQDQLVKDAQAVPELGDMLSIRNFIAGLPNSASYSVFPDDYRVPFQKRRLVGIPETLFQHYNTASVTTHMGLMPELERVWISIDHNLFLWDYMEGEQLSSFTDQPDVITSVALVKPKVGVFIDEIAWLLVICTPISVLLLGVSSNLASAPNRRSRQEIKLYATDMSIPTEVEMTSVIGTSEGRIFMVGAQDGNLYELHYQEKEGWFEKRVQLINHSVGGVQSFLPLLNTSKTSDRIISLVSDVPRNVFYALSSSNTISVYKLAGDKAVQQVQTLSNLYKAAQDKAPGCPALTPQTWNILSLHVIEPSRSQNGPHLLAITVNGLRLYFAPGVAGYSYGYGSSGAPSSGGTQRPLQLIHVRIPPANLRHPDEQSNPCPNAAPAYGAPSPRPEQVSQTFTIKALESSSYDAGLYIAAQVGDVDGTDYVLCLSPDLTRIGTLGQVTTTAPQPPPPAPYTQTYNAPSGPSRPPLTEYATVLSIPGRTWAMAAVPRPPLAAAATSPPDSPSYAITNELASQFSEPSRQFMILTNVGLTFLAKRRALDYLKAVIEEFQVESNAEPLIQFRDSFGRDQTCAMLLAIASGNTFLDIGDQSVGTLSTVSPDLVAVAKQAFYDFGERPIWAERTTYGTGDAASSGSATFSGRREGFALYFARLVRPFWKARLTRPGAGGVQELNVIDAVLVTVQKNLFALKDLLDKSPHLFHSTPGDHTGARSAAASEQEAWKAEQGSVAQLLSLLSRTIEAISFVLLLTDHRLGDLIHECDSTVQKMMTSLTFEQLITTQDGVSASRALVNVIINQQIGQQISVDTISEVLQQRCGSFCSTDDVLLYKQATEIVRKANETNNLAERQRWLGESLRLFSKGARILEFEKLKEICGDYQHLNYAKGAIELPLFCAQVYDADGQGHEYWSAGLPSNDLRSAFWDKRTACYELALSSLEVFEQRATEAAQSGGAAFDPAAVRTHAYELAFQTNDEMFHSTLYDWLISKGLADELLEMRPVYLEAHLRREPITVQKYQLLWQFYVKDGQPLRAAEVLGALAESTVFDLPLEARLEYLTLAVGNAKSHPVSVGGRHETAIAFLTDLEEKLEVAQVQLEMYHTLLPHVNDPGEGGEKVRLLSKTLFNITELYQAFADPFDLPEMKLLIFHVSGHRDEAMIRPIWNKIFEDALDDVEPRIGADRLVSKVLPLGQRFYPSESAFPVRHIASLLVRFGLANKDILPYGWSPRILVQCSVPYAEIWDVLHEMYESQIPPFNEQANVQAVSSDIAVLLSDWLDDVKRPQFAASRGEFPVYRIDQAVDQYLAELETSRTETKATYEAVKRQLRRDW
ncbi:nucleoporin [Irpex rosettiformis]|uniref:Nucleoporin n=1 Tax=Irpex rosettiformis TaxID=378272 RepID=A0ACB8UKZ6_9APHY|nr:nucleoporin [Irpex rosettiformis]